MCFVHSYAIGRVPWSARLTGRMLYWPCKLSTSLREHYNVIKKIEDTFLIAFTFYVHFSVTLDVFKWQDKDVIVHFSSFTRPYGSFTPLKDMFWRHRSLAISIYYCSFQNNSYNFCNTNHFHSTLDVSRHFKGNVSPRTKIVSF